jgi:hypothetical protein
MPVDLQPVIIPSLLPVGPWRASLADQFFALHLATGVFNRTPGAAHPLPAQEKMPWEWGADGDDDYVVIAEHKAAGGASTYDVFGVRLSAEPATPRFGVPGGVTLDFVKANWINREADASWNPTFVGAEKRTEATLAEQLAYVSTFPGDLPQQLKLVRYFRLRPLGADGKSGKNGVIASLDDVDSFIVAPKVGGDSPPEIFEFDTETAGTPKWLDGWTYTSGARAAFVKPLRVRRQGGRLDFSDDGRIPPRLKFESYWPDTEKTQPWTNGLELRCAELFNAFVRLSEAEQPQVAPDATPAQVAAAKEFAASVEALRLKALAFNCPWPRPSDPAAGAAPNDSDKLLKALAEQLDPAFEAEMRDKLRLLFDRLTSPDVNNNRRLWVEILSRNLNSGREPREIFARLHESRELLQQLLFFQWSLLFRLPDFQPEGAAAPGEFFMGAVARAWEALPEEAEGAGGKSKRKVRALFEDYVRRSQREKADEFLEDVFGSAASPDELPQKIVEAAARELKAICRKVGDASPPSLDADASICMSDVWAAYVEAYVKRLGELLAVELGDTERESKPHALTVKFDEPAHEARPANTLPADPDVWRNIAGMVMMLREPGKPWHILSAADIHTRLSAPGVTTSELFDKPAVVPVRIPFRNGVRHPFVTYDQRSLVAESALGPAAEGGGSFRLTGSGDPLAPQRPLDSRYAYKAVLRDAFQLLKLVRLQFGRKYESAVFIMDTAGGVPDELSKSVEELDAAGQPRRVALPWSFDYSRWEGAAPQQDFDVPGANVQRFLYLRQVPVGQVRVTPSRQGLNSWPEPPAGVFPLAKEIKGEDAGDETTKGDPPAGLERRIQATPLALLYGGAGQPTAQIGINLRPPTVDTYVLERWLDPVADKEHLGKVLTDYFTRLSRRNDPAVTQSLPSDELSIDDPAVGALLVVLEKYDFDHAENASGWSLVGARKVVPAPEGEGIGRHQWRGANLLCVRSEGAADFAFVEAPEVGGYKITVPSDHARVARVSIYTLVAKSLTENEGGRKFPRGFFRPQDVQKPEDDEDIGAELAAAYPGLQAFADEFHCLRPFRVLLETPADEMPSPVELWRQFRATRIADPERWNALQKTKTQDREAVALSLFTTPAALKTDPIFHAPPAPTPALNTKFRNVVTCDVLKQTWRWQGRSVDNTKGWLADEPTEVGGEVTRDVLEWEVGAFAEMDDLFDTLSYPVSYTHGHAEPLLIDGYDKDLRAYYVRYAVRAHSRYKGLFPQLATPVTSRQEFRPDGGPPVEVSGTGWRRALVPYRGPKPPKPVVKAVVPLSQDVQGEPGRSGQTAPLMVVLDEAMFSFCGITELVECEVELAQLPKDLAAEGRRLFQVGPDPLLGIDTYVEKLKNVGRLVLRCEDPFGHTFDTDARQPLFSSTSLTLRPQPEAQVAGLASLAAWDMARVRFRRLSNLKAKGEGGGADEDWTKPTWVQFLPAASFGLQWVKEADTHGAAAGGNLAFELKVLVEDPFLFDAEGKFFKYWLLVTKAVRDFRGFRERERYVDTVPATVRNGAGTASVEFRPPEQGGAALMCRLVEVQVSPADEPGTDIWKDLLDVNENSDDAKARITRISPVLSIKPGAA